MENLLICEHCVGDVYLKELIRDQGEVGPCSYCRTKAQTVTLEGFAEIIDGPLQSHCQIAEAVHPRSEPPGDSLSDFLQDEISVEYEIAQDLIDALEAMDVSFYSDGSEPFYSRWDNNYQRNEFSSGAYLRSWHRFCSRIKYQRRFFDDRAVTTLDSIFGSHTGTNHLSILEIGPNTDINKIYRARRVDSADEAKHVMAHSHRELCPPPVKKMAIGRMNPPGIGVFYGALEVDTAVAEVRPPIGGIVVVGVFTPVATLRLLDLTCSKKEPTGSIFAPDYGIRLDRASFLSQFHWLISTPVHPNHEPLEYLPTQAVAEYVRNVLQLDGIVYASSQVVDHSFDAFLDYVNAETPKNGLSDRTKQNIALFPDRDAVLDVNGFAPGDFYLSLLADKVEARRITRISLQHENHHIVGSRELKDFDF